MKNLALISIVVIILLIPLFSFREMMGLYTASLRSSTENLTPWYIKILKDLAYLLIVSFFAIRVVLFDKKFFFSGELYLFYFICAFSALFSLITGGSDIKIIFAGIRWLWPFILIVPLYSIVDFNFQKRIGYALVAVFFLCFIFQWIQLFFFPPYYGTNFLGLNERNTGFFVRPATMGFFTMLTAYYIANFFKKGLFVRIFIWIIAPISILLTSSGTSLITYSIFLGIELLFNTKRVDLKLVTFTLGSLFAIVIILFLPFIVGRKTIYTESGATRIDIFTKYVSDPNYLLVSPNFGRSTNIGVNLQRVESGSYGGITEAEIVDSTYTSLIGNIGVIGLVIFLFFMFKNSIDFHEKINTHFLIIYTLGMFTLILFEMFPANILFALNMAYLLKKAESNKIVVTSETS